MPKPPKAGGYTRLDYIKQMNRSLNDNDPSAYVIPDDADLISQSLKIGNGALAK
ncbi:MAG: hypothetical protein H0A75_04950 [Candidatus Methanofishera endochildressiae]|uniref:Uncharacterized protein n=1 Tax=Candidatus Methanofishera endochildressiae TaxID=2738884 RepID=A0A7Z0MNN9_9GAMM|nr:hypothetical protein [Candidatus Methanofishera endochildressiae]